LDITCFL